MSLSPTQQLEILAEQPSFFNQVTALGAESLQPNALEILQINLGYLCNQTCKHCHVNAGPTRKELISKENLEHILHVLRSNTIQTLDITGGAPEMHPDFKWFIQEARLTSVKEIIVRSNLTILVSNSNFKTFPEFFKEHEIRVVSSLPFYSSSRTDKQRGKGVFQKSIEALQRLNELGYAQPNSKLQLDLVYNPSGAFLPDNQLALEKEYKAVLQNEYNIRFNQLFTITNLPIARFLEYLIDSENYEDYMDTLVTAFNPAAWNNVMCKNTISVDYLGNLYDCDFNQMLHLGVKSPVNHISTFNLQELQNRKIAVHNHCFGCTAGAGSSCQGAVA